MAVIESDGGQPKVKEQIDTIDPGSPMAILGLFVVAIRTRFTAPNADTGFEWRPDPTPLDDEQGTPDAPRYLYIESGDITDPEARDMRPAIFVGVGDMQPQQVVIGNRSDFDRQTRTERFYMKAMIPVTIQCHSDNRIESATIAYTVWMFILSVRNYLRADFGINNVSDPTLSATTLFRRSEGANDSWLTTVTLGVTVELHWITRPIAPMLSEIHQTLTLRGEGNELLGAIRSAHRTTRTR